MSADVERVALISLHTSPLAQAGRADAGGLNVSVLATARQLAGQGVRVDLFTRAVGEPDRVQVGESVTLHAVRAGESGEATRAEQSSHVDEFGEGVAAILRRSGGTDLVHAHYWLSGVATLPVALELGVPFVQSFHTVAALKNAHLAPGDRPEGEVRVRNELFLAHQADAIITASGAEAEAVLETPKIEPDKVWIVPPGVDTRIFTPARHSRNQVIRRYFSLPLGRDVVVVVGRVQPLKGQDFAIRVLHELSRLGGPLPILLIVGESNSEHVEYRRELRRLVDELGLEKDVRFVGAQDREQLANILAIASATLIPSHSETFGLVALESAASGTPVLANAVAGLRSSVSEQVSGYLMEQRDPVEWAWALAELLGDTVKREALGASARRFAEGFTWRRSVTTLREVYRAVARADSRS